MDKSTLSNYGWIVIAVLVLSVMIALATPFGGYIEAGVKSTVQGLFDTSESALNVVGMTAGDGNFEDGYQGGSSGDSGTSTPVKDPALNPDDGTTPQLGDTYETNDYIYCYGYNWCGGCEDWYCNCECMEMDPQNTYQYTTSGWAVRVKNNTKTEYGAICETINGKPITSLVCTFICCENLITAPQIPNSVNIMWDTFTDCLNLKTYVGSIDDDGDFSNYVIPHSVTNMDCTFGNCQSMVIAPVIPDNATRMNSTFYYCTSLTTAPIIPSNVTMMMETFAGCASLNGNIIINTNHISIINDVCEYSGQNCFVLVDMSKITLSGSASKEVLNLIGSTGDNWTPIS